MTRTAAAAATGLPTARRSFLGQLATLPLIGGAVTLIGQPTAVAEPITYDLLWAYKAWLHYEHRLLSHEIADHPRMVAYYGGEHRRRYEAIEPLILFEDIGEAGRYHFPNVGTCAPPSTRAALVMSTVDCEWRTSDRLVQAIRSSSKARRQA